MDEINTILRWLKQPHRLLAMVFFLVSYLAAVTIASYCWMGGISFESFRLAMLIIYAAMVPAMLSTLHRHPQISYFGVIFFYFSIFGVNGLTCTSENSAGGASMALIPVVYFGLLATSLGVAIAWLVFRLLDRD